jgi:hypothetical protein
MKGRPSLWSWLWLLIGTLYFFLPLLATFLFSLRAKKGVLSLLAYQRVLQDPRFYRAFLFSLEIGVLTIVFSIALVVPTAYWIRVSAPQLRSLVEWTTMMPFVIPSRGADLRADPPLQPPPAPSDLYVRGDHFPAGGRIYSSLPALHVSSGGYRLAGHRCARPDGGCPKLRSRLGNYPLSG